MVELRARARTGGIPRGPRATSSAKTTTPSCRLPTKTPQAYAKWAGKRLPTEAEWEFAARGGLAGKPFVWGSEFRPNGKWMANTHQGHFPNTDTGADGHVGIAAGSKSILPNGYGLYDMAGNVWQWTSDWYRPDYYQQLAASRRRRAQPARAAQTRAIPTNLPSAKRPIAAARSSAPTSIARATSSELAEKARFRTGTNHLGFRCVEDAKTSASGESFLKISFCGL